MSAAITISTHVLDTAMGMPAANIAVTLTVVPEHGAATIIAHGVTNKDGRVPALVPAGMALGAGAYRLCFDVAEYFAASQRKSCYARICIDFIADNEPPHYHVPLLLGPFGYSTYRGS